MYNINPHFNLKEFFVCCSETERKFAYQDYSIMNNILHLAQILEYVRLDPIRINSCYRDPSHNKRVGGVANSQHLQGAAVDIWSTDLPALIDRLKNTYAFHQLIIYSYPNHKEPLFVHFGLPTGKNDGQILYKTYSKS